MSLNTILATAPLTTQNYHLKMIGTSIGNSLIWDNGTNVLIGSTTTDFGILGITTSNAVGFTSALGLGFRTNVAEGDSVGISFKTKISLGGTIWENARIAAITESIATSANGALAFYTMNATTLAEKMRIVPSGNVGIGTIAPAYTLDVSGTGRFTSTLLVSGLLTASGFGSNAFSAGGTGYNKLTLRNTTAGVANGAQLSVGTDADADQFYIGSFSTTFTTSGMNIAGGAVVNGEGPGGLSIAATQSNIGFYTNGGAAANLRMNISSDGTIQQYAGTNQATGGSYNTFGNLYVASTTAQGTDIGGSISIGGKYNGAGNYATFARIQGKKENGSSGQTGGYLAFETCTDVTNNNTERMRILSNGCVGIGVYNSIVRLYVKTAYSNNSNYAFYCENLTLDLFYVRTDGLINCGSTTYSPYNYAISGRNAVLDSGGGFGYLVSTRESKSNIKTIESVDFINKLNPVSFNYRKKDSDTNTFTDELNDNITYGFIADEVEKVNKELVFYNEDGTLAGVEYNSMIAILTKAIQELQSQINELKNK